MQTRREPLNLRVSPSEKALLRALAKDEGLPVATFVLWLLKKEAKARGIELADDGP